MDKVGWTFLAGVVLLWIKPITNVIKTLNGASFLKHPRRDSRVSTLWIIFAVIVTTIVIVLTVPQGRLAGDGPGPIGLGGVLLAILVIARRRR